MSVLTEGKYIGDWLKNEGDLRYSRDTITVLAGSGAARVLTSGMVLGKVLVGAGTAAAVAGNTGNGAMGAVTVGAGAKVGVYNLVFIEPASNAGRFSVEDPDGVTVGVGTVAVAFTGGGLSFTLADGATDFASGDAFTITVAAGSGKYVQLDTTGTDGRERAAGLLAYDVTAADAVDAKGVAIVRMAEVSDNGITWPAGISGGNKTAAIAALATAGIIVRAGA